MLTDEQKRIASNMAWWAVNELGESERDPDAVSYFLSDDDFTPDVAEEAATFYNNMIKEYYYRNRVADNEDDIESIF